eukprot:CAMPEP_0175059738 /NCGR_PEP_ID=MMETSP0052_2-20121109/12602_1 /TAXON_ID=51329 ORGANISM="Polytomella parva, Strain SAG 63-3" /NCGR_SAMPLE_ID=MMETSP0052_2 /ASSEMBLY_ACC=CAM_ASM_000194 /LENGTH=374 /DNA_ID=CAMNT_0016325327 /DNA_START=269 /DNA_END=1393 /DNA_ORIENTATION=-
MVDLLFIVDDEKQWHTENLKRNPGHYSWLMQKLGSEGVCNVSCHLGIGVHFNTLVKLDAKTTAKYGVISRTNLEEDLRHWRHLYVAGRLHKPVTHLSDDGLISTALAPAQTQNLAAAIDVARLLLPERFSSKDLVSVVAGLSYHGDIRRGLAEDPKKVQRIVQGSWSELYSSLILETLLLQANDKAAEIQTPSDSALSVGGESPSAGANASWVQSKSAAAQRALLARLPLSLLSSMASRVLETVVPEEHMKSDCLVLGEALQKFLSLEEYDSHQSLDKALYSESTVAVRRIFRKMGLLNAKNSGVPNGRTSLVFDPEIDGNVANGAIAQVMRSVIAQKVNKASICQAAAGVVTAGGEKSFQYVTAKMGKAFKSK